MGVPAFYRWLSEKYPKIAEDVLEDRVHLASDHGSIRMPFDATRPNPTGLECDNLYVDMNGIIHPCSHPEVGEQPSNEAEMYENVCKYVDRLFLAIRPRKLLFLAIDGVAPRAKMNQQRSRRFRSAQEARELAETENKVRADLVETGSKVPPKTAAPWDSNVITPGTKFMIDLSEYVRFYVRKRLATDPAWKGIRVLFSDASVPGEGEHKIMSHVRAQRSQKGYDPNLVHVLHGLDADLIMLALATHEAHFYILREEVTFNRRSVEMAEKRREESGFALLQRILDEAAGAAAMELPENAQKPLQRLSIPILREYLANEFASVMDPPFVDKNGNKAETSFERLIDDVVLLCFFVGNDFLPHLPSLDIRDGALDYLFNVYKRLLPGLGGYLTDHGGKVNLERVDVILGEVGSIEDHVFGMKHANDEKEKRRRRNMRGRGMAGGSKMPAGGIIHAPQEVFAKKGRAVTVKNLKERVKAVETKKLDDFAKNVEDNVRLYEPGWKDRYYKDKCKADDVAKYGGREHLFCSYVKGLCWVMRYYYDGCPSWKWYYPFHYGPFASDLRNIERFEKECNDFELSEPFRPVEQLLGVLPEDSSHAVPKASRWLMGDVESPIIDFYPKDVPCDPNGKAMPWLWVVLLPFIDEERLFAALHPSMKKWKDKELLCNARGLDDGYVFIHKDHALCKDIMRIVESGDKYKKKKFSLSKKDIGQKFSFFGSLRKPLSHELCGIDPDSVFPLPASAGRISRATDIFAAPIEPNEALCFAFTEPTQAKFGHRSVILPAAVPLPSILTDEDRRIRRPKLNRGGETIANLGCSNNSHRSGYGSMNISSSERELAERMGRGGQMNQTGMRPWGAMEPAPKRHRDGNRHHQSSQHHASAHARGPGPTIQRWQPPPAVAPSMHGRQQPSRRQGNRHQQQTQEEPERWKPPSARQQQPLSAPPPYSHGQPPPPPPQQYPQQGGHPQQQNVVSNGYAGSHNPQGARGWGTTVENYSHTAQQQRHGGVSSFHVPNAAAHQYHPQHQHPPQPNAFPQQQLPQPSHIRFGSGGHQLPPTDPQQQLPQPAHIRFGAGGHQLPPTAFSFNHHGQQQQQPKPPNGQGLQQQQPKPQPQRSGFSFNRQGVAQPPPQQRPQTTVQPTVGSGEGRANLSSLRAQLMSTLQKNRGNKG